ncbi:MarR family transcriptional regulator (plasmid) [Paroceanicella profunda]|uniref:MarR family transcriptional regulator n=1 Tax=Paroceanicella profunda TaxID=2579971 RepID=A0A5B8G236_9RHOB|nr:MarR family transcriptional regulator [Paroceanicella profunda]QDL93960.1 MarR family transcriptional regulator [Paroceanicella profunda]
MSPEPQPPVALTEGKLSLRFWLQMLKTTRFLENGMREMLRLEFDTTLPRFDVMAMLERSGHGLKMSELSRQLMVSNGNVTGIVDRLVADGLVVRCSVEGDKRATVVRLTPKGEEDFGRMAARHADWVAGQIGDIPAQDMRRAITMMSDIRRTGR